MAGDRGSRWLGPAALFVFALSGCAGLIYQSIWSQYLGLYLGHAAYAQSLVLAIFMGGMAAGAWWASRRSIHWRNLLRAYALIELVIGVAAALFHPIYVGVTDFAYDSAFPAMPSAWTVEAFKWCSGALLILPQSILLGMTFPLMSNGLMRRVHTGDGAILGGLYFTNSIGAAIGALFATFVLLPAVGLPGAMQFGAILNFVVALVAFVLSRSAESTPDVPAPDAATQDRPAMARLLLIAAFITGATSFVYEIGWVRMLSLAFGSTVHAFELMLAAFIGGLACGGLWIRRRIDGYANLIRVGGWVQLSMGVAALVCLLLYDRSFDWVAWFIRALSRSEGGYALYNAVTGVVAILLMAPAAFFAGMTLPLFTLSLLRNGGGEASIGRIYAANTIGAIVGVFATVHLLIPSLGLKLAMCVGAAGDLVLGLVLLRRMGSSKRSVDTPYLAALAVAGVTLMVALVFARFDPRAMSAGVYRSGSARIAPSERLLFYRDGKTASVSTRVSSHGVVAIVTNGKPDAALRVAKDGGPTPDEITMVMAGVLPLLHHPDPHTAAVIGFGSGLSTHTLLGDPRLTSVDTIEIEPAMVEGARSFGERVTRAYTDPRSHIHIEDAKTYFAANRSRYDIIMAEPSNPWVSGVASLFSQEFYRFVPRHLQPGGLFVQWIQGYEINDQLVAAVVHALSQSFQDYRIYLSYNTDMLIVARADGPVGEIHPEVLDTPQLRDELKRVDIGTAEDIATHRLGDRQSLAPLFDSATTRTTSDFRPFLTLEAPRARFIGDQAQGIFDLPTVDLPFRTVLGRQPVPRAEKIVDSPNLKYSGAVHRAARIAASLRDATMLDRADDAVDATAIAYLRETVGKCAGDTQRQESILDAIVRIAGRTIPFLDADGLQGVWIDAAWIKCQTQDPKIRSLLAVVAAMSRSDWETVQHDASALLQDDSPQLSLATRDWLLRAAMLGAIGAGNFAAVAEIDNTLGKHVEPFGITLKYRAYLLAFAEQRLAATRVAAGH
jgi:predicted membrane-bound spermidine synthase